MSKTLVLNLVNNVWTANKLELMHQIFGLLCLATLSYKKTSNSVFFLNNLAFTFP